MNRNDSMYCINKGFVAQIDDKGRRTESVTAQGQRTQGERAHSSRRHYPFSTGTCVFFFFFIKEHMIYYIKIELLWML